MNKPTHSESEESLEPVNSSTEDVTTKPKKQGSQRRWVKWSRRLGIFIIILGILAFLINGPVARWATLHFLNKALEEQGMTGSAEVEGTIIGGLSVRDLSYTGELGIQKLRISSIVPKYTISGLLDSKIEGIEVDTIHAKIDVSGFPTKTEEEVEKDPEATLEKTLAGIRPWLVQPEIDIKDLDVALIDGEKPVLNWQLASLSHAADSEEFYLNDWMVEEASGLKTPVQTVALTWQEKQLSLDRLEVLPDLVINELNLNWEAAIRGDAKISLDGASFEASADDSLNLKLTDGKIDSSEVLEMAKKLGADLAFDGEAVVSELDLKLEDWKNFNFERPDFNLSLKTKLEKAKYQKYDLTDTELSIEQNGQDYELKLDGKLNSARVDTEIKGSWTQPEITPEDGYNWWESTKVNAKVKASFSDELLELVTELPEGIDLSNAEAELDFGGEVMELEKLNVKPNLKLRGVMINGETLPLIEIESGWDNTVDEPIAFSINVQDDQSDTIQIQGKYDPKDLSYLGAVVVDIEDLNNQKNAWINGLLDWVKAPVKLNGEIQLSWNGSGNIETNEHLGSLEVKKVNVLPTEVKDALPVKIQTKTNYNWPNSVTVEKLDLQQEELSIATSLSWDGTKVNLTKTELYREGELIGSVNGEIPYKLSVGNLKAFVDQEAAWMITVDTEELSLERLAQLFPLEVLEGASGILQTKLNVTGSPSEPDINGKFSLKALKGIYDSELGPLSILLDLESKAGKLDINGVLTEYDKERITLDVILPFKPKLWLEDDNLLETLKRSADIQGKAVIKKLPLGRLKKFFPQLETVEGMVEGVALFQGTILDPKYSLEFHADFPVLHIKDIGVDDIKELEIHGKIDERLVFTSELSAKVNGGKFVATLEADVNDAQDPSFELNLKPEYALIYRDDLIATRANGNILFKGKLSDATISGDVGIVESLIFKDMDLIPIGVPSSAVGAVRLPSLDSKKASQGFGIPAPFGDWKLALNIRTEDPILLRGNVGKGRIEGAIKAGGTLNNPALDGTLYVKDVRAKLPFSILRVDNGEIIFRPQNGLTPTLQIRGKSQIGNYNVNLNIYGAADSPKTAFSSYPPLPEHEIMTLLATGTTNAGLENRDVATFKALQILLLELKERNSQPGGNKLFGALLSGIQDLDLRVGEVDDLTGEKFSSATVQLHERWYLTTQFDSTGQTRGLVVFALRFN